MKRTDVVHLVCYVLEPAMRGLDTGDHLGQLCADDGLSVQWFAERLPLLGPPARGEKSLVNIEKRWESRNAVGPART
jgi:hypothetical protein